MTQTVTPPPVRGETTSTSTTTPVIRTDWSVREGRPDDVNFVLHSWLKSTFHDTLFSFKHEPEERTACRVCRRRFTAPQHIPEEVFYAVHQGAWTVQPPENHQGPVIHYAYVKSIWRHRGVFRALMKGLPRDFTFTSRTPDFERVLTHYNRATYNPYLLLGAT